MSQHLTDQNRADLARILHEAIEADRYPFSPKVRRLKERLAKIDPESVPAAHPRPPPRCGGSRSAPVGVVNYARMRTGGTSLGISRLQPVVALTSSTEMPGAISRNVMPSGVISNSP